MSPGRQEWPSDPFPALPDELSITTICTLALVGILVFIDLPKDSNGVVFMLFGALASGFTGIVGYFFGSSAGHTEATRLLSQAPPVQKRSPSRSPF